MLLAFWLLDGERKSIEPMANRLEAIEGGKEDYEQALQPFVSQSHPGPKGGAKSTTARLLPRCRSLPRKPSSHPKWQLVLDLVHRARDNGLSGIVLAESGYGDVTEVRETLAREGWSDAVAIPIAMKVVDSRADFGEVPARKGTGRSPTRPSGVRAGAESSSVKEWVAARLEEFRSMKWREGTKRKLRGRFAATMSSDSITSKDVPHRTRHRHETWVFMACVFLPSPRTGTRSPIASPISSGTQ